MSVSSINLLVLRSKNPSRLIGFYQALGLNFVLEKHGNGPEHHACAIGGAVLEIYPCKNDSSMTSETRLGFLVTSMSEALANLPNDHEVVSPPKLSSWGLRCILKDPEGHRVELLEST